MTSSFSAAQPQIIGPPPPPPPFSASSSVVFCGSLEQLVLFRFFKHETLHTWSLEIFYFVRDQKNYRHADID